MTPHRPSLYWVVGGGGLLGSRLKAAISRDVPGGKCWDPPVNKFSWNSPTQLEEQLAECASHFGHALRRNGHDCSWGILWTAGAGVIGTTEQLLEAETVALQALLSAVHRHLDDVQSCAGLIFLSSSAGGVYGNCPDQTITEDSECRPMSPYGANKRRQEELLSKWAHDHPWVTCRIGRISNLYGAGQNLFKPQGLISHISKCVIWQQPIHVYVPLDTIRDYLHVDDCSRQIANCITAWAGTGRGSAASWEGMVKIFASEEPASVAQIIGEFVRLPSRRHPRVICAPNALGLQQPRRLLFRSIAGPNVTGLRRTSLQVGIDQVHRHQTRLYCEGRLAPPVAKA